MEKIEFLSLKNEVACYLTDLNEIDSSFINTDILSDSERKEYLELNTEFRKKEWLAGRAIMKNVVNYFFEEKIDLKKISLDTNCCFTHSDNSIYYSISHNKHYAIAVASSDPVGIDIEMEREFSEALKTNIFSREDMASTHSLNLSENQKLILLWTMKEATFKAISEGTHFHLKDISITHNKDKFVTEYNLNNSTLKCDIHYIKYDGNFITLATLRRFT